MKLEANKRYVTRNGSIVKLLDRGHWLQGEGINNYLYCNDAKDGHLVFGESEPHGFDIIGEYKEQL